MARIVIVYNDWRKPFELKDMAYIRWVKMGEALCRLGHQVDLPTNEIDWMKWWQLKSTKRMQSGLRRIPLSKVKWEEYDVVKTIFHHGFNTLKKYQGDDHPFIISKLGSVVGAKDMDGVFFYGTVRDWLYKTQIGINDTSHYITILTEKAKELWIASHETKDNFLLVPGGVDAVIPHKGKNPFPKDDFSRCIFAGNVYSNSSQPEANQVLIEKLNRLGEILLPKKIRVYLLGPGDTSLLNPKFVSYLGAVPYERSWDYFYHADVGIVVSAGKFMHNNESTKIYHYLRAGLPCVSESGFPNDYVVEESKLGYVVKSENMDLMASKIIEAVSKKWNHDFGVNYILKNHTWDKRAQVYDSLIQSKLGDTQ